MDLFVLKDLVVVLAASVLIIYVSHKLRLPSVVGFLLTGVLIGPGGLSLVKNDATVGTLAEIGVVMLLFTIGLEFEPARLRRIRRNFVSGGSLQVVLTTGACVAILTGLLRLRFREALFYGFLISLSSTAVVLKILGDRGETDSPQGRISLGILIFQDLAIVPMIALVPVLANAGSVPTGAIAVRFALSGAAVAGVFVVARFLMPLLLNVVVRTRVREAFLIATLFLCLGMALLTSSLGLSLALGAFLAGVLLAESPYSHQVVSDILPFKDVFNSIFFIAVGMLLDAGAVWKFLPMVLVLVAAILIVKTLAAVSTVVILGHDPRVAVVTGLALAQVGEFSFVLAGVGRANGFLSGDIFQAFIASSILTILATPFLIQASPGLADLGSRKFHWKWRPPEEGGSGPGHEGHVIIAGYGLNGKNLAHVLKEAGIPYVILDLNPVTVREAAAEGEPIIFGDVSRRTILQEAGIARARGIVFAISDPLMTQRGVKAVKALNPDVFIIVRTRYATEIERLLKLGADDVIPEEFETSIEIFTRVLEKYHVPRNVVEAEVKVLRGECYGMLRGACAAIRPVTERIADLLAAGTAETYFVGRGAWPAGRTLGDLDLRGLTGATVIAVVRGAESFTSPGADFRVEDQDTLVLVASHRDVDRAFAYLTTGEPDEASLPLRRWPSILLVGPTGSGKTPLGDEIERRGLLGRRSVHFDFGANLRAAAEGSGQYGLTAEELDAVRGSLASGAL
ncbi:MAG TPA: monovalent cation:proton antiporter-2 (CPA2) family protein, partial [Acidobacteriota bacterium]|nr:monovalent cation:proton antiporter-2 (CPA2) family protein [Acidobacteriota bacterium]